MGGATDSRSHRSVSKVNKRRVSPPHQGAILEQSRIESFVEAVIGTAIGFVVSVLLSMIVYPIHGHSFTLAQNASITAIFTVASIARVYVVRRYFNARIKAAAARVASAVS